MKNNSFFVVDSHKTGWTTRQQTCLTVTLLLAVLLQPSNGQTSLFSGYAKKREGLIDDILTVSLSNGDPFPLVGLGVGNLQYNLIENMIYEGIKVEHGLRMIDTSFASQNEALVANGIVNGVRRFRKTENHDGPVQVHIVTKVWYTHLGYERTKMSVQESFDNLKVAIQDPNVDLRVHMLIHWPQCFDTIPWMHCEDEENALPAKVKDAGPPPHLNPGKLWKESWRALEDMYLSADLPELASIGISNFQTRDIRELVKDARVNPHMIQMNFWSVFFDIELVNICNKYKIHMQLYSIMNGIIPSLFTQPKAHHHLLKAANSLDKRKPEDGRPVEMTQAVLKWLLHFEFSIVVRTANIDRLRMNSAVALMAIPEPNDEELTTIAQASRAMMEDKDLTEDVYVEATFHAATKDMFLYFIQGKEDFRQIAFIQKGQSHKEYTHPKANFRLYLATDPDVYKDFTVQGRYGDSIDHHVEL